MRLLLLIPEFVSGSGIATFYRHLAAALVSCGVEVRVVEGSAVHCGQPAPTTIGGVRVETLEKQRFERWNAKFGRFSATPSLRRHLAAAWALWEQADRGSWADIVESSDWGLAFLPPLMEATRPLVVQAHSSVGQISQHDPIAGEEAQGALIRLIESAAFTRSTCLQTYSHANAAFWRSETGRDVTMIRPAFPLRPDRSAGEVSDRGLVIGRIQRWKGVETLCRAMALMGPRAPMVDWIGHDTDFGRRGVAAGVTMARAYPTIWGRQVVPISPVQPADVAARQAAALFNLVPSDWDVFNFTAAEAMTSGRPTVVGSGAGASELLTDGENGFLFESGDPSSLVAALDRLLSTPPGRLASIAAAARETVRHELNPSRIAESRVRAYRRAIGDFAELPPAPVSGWLGDVCRPSEESPSLSAFLSLLPIRDLATHLASRLGEKIPVPASRSRRP